MRRCHLCPRFSSSHLCARCTAHVEHHTSLLVSRLAQHVAVILAEQEQEQEIEATPIDPDTTEVKPAPDPVASGDVAAGGKQGAQARDLLTSATSRTQRLLTSLVKTAVTRQLTAGRSTLLSARQLFSPDERQQLAQGLASILAPANLLGRARVRERLTGGGQRFADDIKPMPPEKALAYFQGLVPGVGGDPQRFGQDQRRRAFTLAVSTEKGLLDRVKGVLVASLESGESPKSTTAKVQEILDRAGVSPRNSNYASMVVRTNLMDSMNRGQMEEMQDPDIAELFPVWRYDGIDDARASLDHRRHFGKYYPNGVSFEAVRGPRIWNCRCSCTPIDATEWEELQAKGARVEPGYGSAPKAPAKKPAPRPTTPPPAALPDPGDVYMGKISRAEMERIARQVGVDPSAQTDYELRNNLANRLDQLQTQSPQQPVSPPSPAPAAPTVPQKPLPKGKAIDKKKPLADTLAKAAEETEELSPQQRQEYAATMKQVVAKMPPTAQKAIKANLNRVTYYPEQKQITEGAIMELLESDAITPQQRAFLLEKLEETRAGKHNAGGVYSQVGGVHLDGDYDYKKDGTGEERGRYTSGAVYTRRDVYAHELTHAIDGPEGSRLSDADEWEEAWQEEINYDRASALVSGREPPLTAYAASMPVEGFAEFGRLLYGTDVPLEQIERDFPKASAYFKAKGLWPKEKKSGKAKKADEVFDQRIDLDDKGSHIDTVKKPRRKG